MFVYDGEIYRSNDERCPEWFKDYMRTEKYRDEMRKLDKKLNAYSSYYEMHMDGELFR